MSKTEINRACLCSQITTRRLSQKHAAEVLGLSDRQVRRLVKAFRKEGSGGLIHRARGKPSNRRLATNFTERVLDLVREKYPGFGPTLASEKLAELDRIRISSETLRRLMTQHGLWKPKKRKVTHRSWRERKACFGEMIQFDGSHHHWLESRGESCVLLASRDDATNCVHALFVPFEGTKPVFCFWRDYFNGYGKPQSIYLDRHGTYKVNHKNALDNAEMLSQFERAMDELGVKVIHAHSPQAKGRIENLFGTFQDRLVKELRLHQINTVTEANQLLTVYLPWFNRRFGVLPKEPADLHQPLTVTDNLAPILSLQSKRYVNRDFTIRFNNRWLQLTDVQPTLVLPKSEVIVEERLDESVHLRLNDHYLNYQVIAKPIKTERRIIALTNTPPPKPRTWKPAPNHPWRRYALQH